MARYTVETDELLSVSKALQTLAKAFYAHYMKYLEEGRAVNQGWTGDDATAFIKKVNDLEEGFQAVYNLLQDASTALEYSAGVYKSILEVNVTKANGIPNLIQ